MEEKKFDKDINVRSKDDADINVGMTDEEIVKALKHCSHNRSCAYCYHNNEVGSGQIICRSRLIRKAIDLIHRLQNENAEQKAEIERLKKHIKAKEISEEHVRKMRGTDLRTIAELQKQVDELKAYAEDIYKKAIDREEAKKKLKELQE